MSRSILCSLALVVTPLLATPVLADSPWGGSIGASVVVTPDYLGSDDYKNRVVPNLDLKYGDLAYLSWRDGLGVNIYRNQDWTLSPFVGLHVGRDNKGDISAFEKVDAGLTAGLRVSYQPNAWRYSLKVQTPVTGDLNGYRVSLRGNLQEQIAPKWFVGISPGLSYSSSQWTQGMFDVSHQDAQRSGLNPYRADAGYLRFALNGNITYMLAEHWSITGIAGATQLTGDAKDSPIVKQVGDATQVLAGMAVSYHF